MDMYRENILDHNSSPRNYREISEPSFSRRELNVSCGDDIQVFVTVEDGKIADASFQGDGCAITKATTSMMTEYLVGKSVDEVAGMNHELIFDLVGTELSGSRLRCGTLGLVAFQNALTEENI